MKYLLHLIILCVLVGMHGCGNRRADSVFAVADSLMKDRPDSALTLLNALYDSAAGKMSRRQKMRLELMRVEAQNKSYVNFTTDSVMREVTAYYDAHGTAQERMRAHYLLGCVYRDLGDAPRALECYHDAVSCADTTDVDCDFQRLSRIYGQMADLFHAQRSPQFEKEAELNAIRMAWKAKDTLAALNLYAHLADVYHLIGDKDSALFISQDACSLLKKYGYERESNGFIIMQYSIFVDRNEFDKADKLLHHYEKGSGFFDKEGNIKKGGEIFYFYRGKYYYGVNMLDSSLYFYKKLLYNANNINSIEAASKGLMQVYQQLGKPDSVMKYAQMFADANDSACLISSAEEINRANALYNYNASRRQTDTMKQKAEKYKHTIAVGCILFIVVISLVTYIIIRYRQKTKSDFLKLNTRYFKTLDKYNQSEKDLQLLNDDINKFKTEKEKETENLRQELAFYTNGKGIKEEWDAEQYLLNCDMIKNLHNLTCKGTCSTDTEFRKLIELSSHHLSTFHDYITASKHGLSEREIIACILIKLRFTPSEIAILLECSKQVVSNIRTNINHKLFNQKGTKSLDSNIRHL
ncbi:MAG: hypothetical protein UHZ01_07835 [Prevotella sp.]|nr:hypothetical protein [Prevotella sp.]